MENWSGVHLITSNNCPACVQLKHGLNYFGIPFQEHSIQEIREMNLNFQSVPIIFHEGEMIFQGAVTGNLSLPWLRGLLLYHKIIRNG